ETGMEGESGKLFAVAKAGGTDLLDLLKEQIVEPGEVVSLLAARAEAGPDEVSALATLAEVAADRRIRADFPALAAAAGAAATPQIRNFGTVGGNLCQHTRCWYFRNLSFDCYKRGNGFCSALPEDAHNRYHAIFPHPRCGCAHPSNLAPALIALGARVDCVHPDGNRTLDVELLYRPPKKGRIHDTVLRPGEVIRAVLLAPSPMTRRSVYREFRERHSFDFAVVSVAAAVALERGVVRDARIVFGAVASTPHRARAAEEVLRGKALDPAAAAGAAVAGAEPLAQSSFKVRIARTLVRRALEELKG
ncbi:MAG: FAD binding domain-containing protein, partial [Planctomycetota bacterium]